MKDMQVFFVSGMELMISSDMMKDILGYPWMMCSTSDEMIHSVYVKDLEGGIVVVGEWYRNETLLSKT